MFKKGELPLSAVAKRQLTQRIKEFKGLSREQRKELLKETWQETAYTVALRASTFMSTAGDQSTTSKALSLAVNNLTIRRNRVIGGDWNFAYSGSGDISGNEFRGARSRGWQIVGTGQSVHAYRNRFIGGGVGIGVNASGPDGTVRLTDNTLSGYTVGVQRSDAVQVQSQGNSFWANGQHAVGVTLDGSTRYTP